MALTINGKTFRNLQEQVEYMTLWLSANALANEMGIKTLGRVDSEADLPANDPDHPFQYGDAYMVGEEGHTPYRMSIWTRDAGDGNPGWFDIGYFPTAPDQFSLVEINGQVVHIFNADTKLDKITGTPSYPKAYVLLPNGNQGSVEINANATADTIVRRTGGSQINVPYTPTEGTHAASKDYVDSNFLLKATGISTYGQAYVKAADGSQTRYDISVTANAYSIPYRDGNGQQNLPDQSIYTPGANQAISKSYADAHYASGVTRYAHHVVASIEMTNGEIYPIVVSYVDGSSSPTVALAGHWQKDLYSVSAYDMGENADHTEFKFAVVQFITDNHPVQEKGEGFLIHKIGGSDVVIDGTDDENINSVSVTDTVYQI